jgi:DNA integrity scanning protein DisA with diadenylate cyclase activity
MNQLKIMEIETEMTTELTDVSEILQKVTQVVNSAKEMGFNVKELEIKSEDDHTDDD